jgi:hypothetical protein
MATARDYETAIAKGVIEIDYCPTMCMSCTQILVNTFVRKDDEDRIKKMHIYCDDCFNMLLRKHAAKE